MAGARKREADPPTQLRELESALAGGELARGYVLRGDERWFRERGIEALSKLASERGLELTRHDKKDPEFDLSSLLDDLGAPPMFASGRLVIVRNADELTKKVGSAQSPFVRAALSWLGRAGEGSLVVDAGALRADSVLSKAVVKANGRVLSFRRLYESPPPWRPGAPHEAELVQWLLGRARAAGVTLRPDEAVYVASAIGNDLSALDAELEKLRHADGRGVREIVGWQSGGTPWDTAGELIGGDPARSLSALEGLFGEGFHKAKEGSVEVNSRALAAILLGQLRARAREAQVAARALLAGRPLRAGGGPPARAQAALAELEARVRSRPPAHWTRVWRDVAELDRTTRTGATVDVNDFARLALRWSHRPADDPTSSRR